MTPQNCSGYHISCYFQNFWLAEHDLSVITSTSECQLSLTVKNRTLHSNTKQYFSTIKVNQLSSFIDGTTVYGFTSKHLNLLLDNDKMHLKMQDNRHGDLLPALSPFNNAGLDKKFGLIGPLKTGPQKFNDNGHDPFVAGDNRVGEFPGTVLTMF